MSDLVERLRGDLMTPYQATQLMDEAAARIEQLEADQRDTTEEFGRLSHDLGNAMLEIERLRAERDEQVQWVKDLADSLMEAEGKIGVKNDRIEQLEAALREISDCKTFTDRKYMIDLARAALEERT